MKTLSVLILLGCLLVIAGYAADEDNAPQDQPTQVSAPAADYLRLFEYNVETLARALAATTN